MPIFKRPGTVWVNLQVPAALHDIVKHLSVDSGESAQAIYLGLVRAALDAQRERELNETV